MLPTKEHLNSQALVQTSSVLLISEKKDKDVYS